MRPSPVYFGHLSKRSLLLRSNASLLWRLVSVTCRGSTNSTELRVSQVVESGAYWLADCRETGWVINNTSIGIARNVPSAKFQTWHSAAD